MVMCNFHDVIHTLLLVLSVSSCFQGFETALFIGFNNDNGSGVGLVMLLLLLLLLPFM